MFTIRYTLKRSKNVSEWPLLRAMSPHSCLGTFHQGDTFGECDVTEQGGIDFAPEKNEDLVIFSYIIYSNITKIN
jgi:hypothetical protein